ncbi:MAG TPA: ferritin family protein [Spirochaetia bacterium]|nr:ferritin family protein [Spirochaetia bacterium]
MEELSVQQVIEFSQSIEEESHNFYTEASLKLDDPGLKALTEELAAAEVEHLNRLRRILQLKSISREELNRRVRLETSTYEKVISVKGIETGTTAQEILNRALARETATASTYRMLVSMTNLSSEVVELFSYLATQEAGHVTTIKNKLERL